MLCCRIHVLWGYAMLITWIRLRMIRRWPTDIGNPMWHSARRVSKLQSVWKRHVVVSSLFTNCRVCTLFIIYLYLNLFDDWLNSSGIKPMGNVMDNYWKRWSLSLDLNQSKVGASVAVCGDEFQSTMESVKKEYLCTLFEAGNCESLADYGAGCVRQQDFWSLDDKCISPWIILYMSHSLK